MLRGTLGFLLLMGVFAGTAQAASVPDLTAFPVVGNVTYIADFGAPRPQGPHEGNDIMAIRHQPAVAFERGKVKIWYRSGSSTCMLYLYGRSGMTYVYIHLNNDLGATNDNKAGCAKGAYAPGLKTGQQVRRGQLVGYVGDSGDADGIQPHLHFEVRTPSGRAIDPYSYLNKAKRVLYPRPVAADPISLTLKGAKVLRAEDGKLAVMTRRVKMSNGWSFVYKRKLVLAVASDAAIVRRTPAGSVSTSLAEARVGERVWVRTTSFAPTWPIQRADPLVLSAVRIFLRG